MSDILEWLKGPMPKGEHFERYVIELKDRSVMKFENINHQLVRDGFFILESKTFGSVMINVNDIKTIYTNLFVCDQYTTKERPIKAELDCSKLVCVIDRTIKEFDTNDLIKASRFD